MTVTAPGPVAATAALAKLALPLPTGAAPGVTARAPDHVELSPPPTVRALWELAFAGSQHLDALLPALERMLQTPSPMPAALGHLARAVGDAAHQIDAGSADLAARNDTTRPTPEALDGWRQTARTTLHGASELLSRAEFRLNTAEPIPSPLTIDKVPETLWALTQIAAAQHQVGATLGNFGVLRRASAPVSEPVPSRPFTLGAPIALFGILLFLLIYAAAYGMWLTLAGLMAAGGAIAWVWRAVAATRNLKIEVNR